LRSRPSEVLEGVTSATRESAPTTPATPQFRCSPSSKPLHRGNGLPDRVTLTTNSPLHRLQSAKKLMGTIDREFGTLPWCRRYLDRLGESGYLLGVSCLATPARQLVGDNADFSFLATPAAARACRQGHHPRLPPARGRGRVSRARGGKLDGLRRADNSPHWLHFSLSAARRLPSWQAVSRFLRVRGRVLTVASLSVSGTHDPAPAYVQGGCQSRRRLLVVACVACIILYYHFLRMHHEPEMRRSCRRGEKTCASVCCAPRATRIRRSRLESKHKHRTSSCKPPSKQHIHTLTKH
jgi:hypothetical protein